MDNWRPSASLELLQARAQMLHEIRGFFKARDVLEVETPLLAQNGVTDPQLLPFESAARVLQTSPEYAMKRLLASHSGAIYQICKAFRQEESGARHNPEFTLLEWYQPGFSLAQLMDEVQQLLELLLPARPVHRYSYVGLFKRYLGVDPFSADFAMLLQLASSRIELDFRPDNRDALLNLLLSHLIEPQLPRPGLVFVYDYPASQAALARLRDEGGYQVGERFEAYVDGLELANGYRELIDAQEQERRFQADNLALNERGMPERPIDQRLLAAMTHGLPECAGVALGLDRLLMLRTGENDIRKVLAFEWNRA